MCPPLESDASRALSPSGRWERIEISYPHWLIAFRRLTLRSAPGTPQRGGPYLSKPGAEGAVADVRSGILAQGRSMRAWTGQNAVIHHDWRTVFLKSELHRRKRHPK